MIQKFFTINFMAVHIAQPYKMHCRNRKVIIWLKYVIESKSMIGVRYEVVWSEVTRERGWRLTTSPQPLKSWPLICAIDSFPSIFGGNLDLSSITRNADWGLCSVDRILFKIYKFLSASKFIANNFWIINFWITFKAIVWISCVVPYIGLECVPLIDIDILV